MTKRPKPIPISECTITRMMRGNEKKFSKVIDRGNVCQWVGFTWVTEGPATEADYLKYPTVQYTYKPKRKRKQ